MLPQFVIIQPYLHEHDVAIGVQACGLYCLSDGDAYSPAAIDSRWPHARYVTWVELEAWLEKAISVLPI